MGWRMILSGGKAANVLCLNCQSEILLLWVILNRKERLYLLKMNETELAGLLSLLSLWSSGFTPFLFRYDLRYFLNLMELKDSPLSKINTPYLLMRRNSQSRLKICYPSWTNSFTRVSLFKHKVNWMEDDSFIHCNVAWLPLGLVAALLPSPIDYSKTDLSPFFLAWTR